MPSIDYATWSAWDVVRAGFEATGAAVFIAGVLLGIDTWIKWLAKRGRK